jgi:protein-tyrosine phosphatase
MSFADLHCHLLWATDDGPRDQDESLRLCELLVEHGFSDAAPTPYAWPELPSAAENAARRAELQALLEGRRIPLRLHPGAEHRLDGALLERIGQGDVRPLGPGPWVLVEAPHSLPLPGLEQLIFRLQIAGQRVLVAHPERCRAFEDDHGLARRLTEAGCALQLEIGALAGHYGRPAKKLAQRLLGDGLYSVAASDVHRPQSAEKLLTEGLPLLRKAAGDALLRTLLDDNPRRVLRGEALS